MAYFCLRFFGVIFLTVAFLKRCRLFFVLIMILPPTSRLTFRRLDPVADLMQAYRMQSDPDVMRFIRTPDTDIESVKARLLLWKDYEVKCPDMGVWLIVWAETGAIAGHCVLREAEWKEGNDLEIGYVLLKEFWGKGIATEVARNLCDYAFSRFDRSFLIAYVDPENASSRHVLEKCGFKAGLLVSIYDSVSLTFKLERTQFQT